MFPLEPRWQRGPLLSCACGWVLFSLCSFLRIKLPRGSSLIRSAPWLGSLPTLTNMPHGFCDWQNWTWAWGLLRTIFGREHFSFFPAVSAVHLQRWLSILFSMSRYSVVWGFSHYLVFHIGRNSNYFLPNMCAYPLLRYFLYQMVMDCCLSLY